ncbi:MAG: hypothetical protein COB02_09575 [Candidatus Cloacimonadota bacterium]|nr:MAG: hypothetical protein COB02_09575 [Candidatus Cloacimonadota bacterium]
MNIKKYLLSAIIVLSLGQIISANPCIENVAAIDLGSGSTKLLVAKVDSCERKILKVLHEDSVRVDYFENLRRSSDSTFSRKMMFKGLNKVIALKSIADKYNPSRFTIYATEAFRRANNVDKFFKKIKRYTGVLPVVLSADEEGTLGLLALSVLLNKDPSSILSWDIGAGSMQISSMVGNTTRVFQGRFASETFKNYVKSRIKSNTQSPNPLSKAEVQIASEVITEELQEIPSWILNHLKLNDGVIYGIGGVHYHSVRELTGWKDYYTVQDVKRALSTIVDKSDAQIGGPFPETQVTNLILVLEYMKALGVKKVFSQRVNMAYGALVL